MGFRKKNTRRRPGNDQPRYTQQAYSYYSATPSANKTTSGTSSRPPVHAESKRRQPKDVSRQQHIKAKAGYLPYYFSAFLITVSLIYCSFLGNSISVIMPNEQHLQNQAYYQEQLTKLFNQSVLNRSKITFNPVAYKKQAMAQMPELSDMTVRLPVVGRSPVVNLAFTHSALLFSASNRQYVVSDDGIVLAEAVDINGFDTQQLIAVKEQVPLKMQVGKPALTKDMVRFIQEVYHELSHANATVDSMTLPLGASELYVRVKDAPYYVKFASETGVGAKQQVGAYLALVHTLKEQSQIPGDYIDVRLGERVFVK